jgi:hypothetical protein
MKMKTRFFSTLSLLAVLLAACAPGTVQPPAVVQPAVANPTATFLVDIPSPTLEAATQAVADAPTAIIPIATSRGPNLEATDPTTVNLASGQIQFVEFFRFT